MTAPVHLQETVSTEAFIPAAPLESILCTDELLNRPRRPPNYEKENAALAALVKTLADSPGTILQTLADKVLETLDADSAGLSLLTKDRKRFYWAAIAGAWRPHLGGGTPRHFGPCGDVLDRNSTMLFTHWERRYPYLSAAMPLAEEGLLVPFYVEGKSVGTIWTIAHRNHRKFDAEDQRLLESMGRFASAAYQTLQSIEGLKSEVAAREKAETELRMLTGSLEGQVRVRTQELAEARRELQLTIDTVPAMVATFQPDGGRDFVNKTWRDYFGLTSQETADLAQAYVIRLHPDEAETVDNAWRKSLVTGQPFQMEMRILGNDGRYRWHTARRVPLRNANGDVAKWYGVLIDIEEQKSAEAALRHSEALLAEAQRLSSTGSFCWRVAPDEITWSEQLYRIFEFDRCTPVTLGLIGTRVHPADSRLFDEMINRARSGDDDFDCEYRLKFPNGSVKYVHVIAHGTRDEDGRLLYIGAAQDITQRRLSEEALAKVRSELELVARVTRIGVLTASIAHEINQPLAAITTNAESSLRWLDRDEPNIEKARTLINRVVADAQRASEIIVRIREMASRRAPEQKELSINDVIRESLSLLQNELQLKGTAVSLDLKEGLPCVVGNRTQLQQVIINLVVNAVQAMTKLAPADRRISVRAVLSDPETLCCEIEDSGPGIDPSHLSRLFDSFFTTKDTGMGMGLAISRSILEAHRGRIRADNNSALNGARFILELPTSHASVGGRAKRAD